MTYWFIFHTNTDKKVPLKMSCSSVPLVSKWPSSPGCSPVKAPAEQQDEIQTNIFSTWLRLEMLLHCKWESGYCGEEISFESLLD